MHCKNCNTEFNVRQNFCFECGAKVIRNRLKPKVLFEQVNEEFLSADNRLLRTFIHLFTKPEAVINGYVNGIRKKYIGVIQYFAIGLTLLGIQVFFMTNVFNDPDLYKNLWLDSLTKLPNQTDNPFTNPNFQDFNSSQSLLYTLSIPISAFATWITYWILGLRQFNFTEHVVINLYYGAQVVIISAFTYILFLGLGFNYFTIGLYITLLIFIYFFFVLKRVFKTSFWKTVAHFLLMIVLFFIMTIILLVIFGIILAIYMIMTNTHTVTTIT